MKTTNAVLLLRVGLAWALFFAVVAPALAILYLLAGVGFALKDGLVEAYLEFVDVAGRMYNQLQWKTKLRLKAIREGQSK